MLDCSVVMLCGDRSCNPFDIVSVLAQTHRGKRKLGYKAAPHGGNGESTNKGYNAGIGRADGQ
eukprot:7828806-Heterocapsa_arctica.AAC.1